MNEFLKYAAIVLFANAAFLFGLRWVTKGKYVRKDVLMAILVPLFAAEGCAVLSGAIHTILGTQLVGATIIVVVGGLVVAKNNIPGFSMWLETRVGEK